MTAVRYDVLGLGNAIVDVITRADEDFLVKHGMRKGTMSLIDEGRAALIYDAMGPAVEVSGGSAANTVVGTAGLGARAAFIGRVKDDALGTVFMHDIRAAGVVFDTAPSAEGPSTGRCYVLVTPDGERTMNTYLGAAQDLHPRDIDGDVVAGAAITYLEGYLWDQPRAKEAFRHAARVAHAAGRRVALTLSDGFCVDRHRADFHTLVDDEVDILFANEAEIRSLYEVDDFDDALQRVQHHCEIAALTRSERGAVIVARDEVHVVDAHPVPDVVDTTGAGDQFAAGFLFGLTHGYHLGTAARLGARAAAEVIGHLGARPETALATLAAPLLAD